jgi:glutamine amidotransferase
MIAIVDYGMGNLFSIYNALCKAGGDPIFVRDPSFDGADGIVVPGVGSFGKCMEQLEGFRTALEMEISQGTPVLGICIGMQVLFDSSMESSTAKGFGFIPGKVVRLPEGVMIPQMGWNSLCIKKDIDLLEGINDKDQFYFVHSYYCVPDDDGVIAATTQHGVELAACVSKDNLCATQFHPEKSGGIGLRILENFVRSTRC